MAYTIEEKNLVRQHLLAEVLDPLTLSALKFFSLGTGSLILDIGCGLGDTSLLLSENFPGTHITGIDLNEELIRVAIATKELYPNMRFLNGDATSLPFDNGHFDFVFCRYLLHHIPNVNTALEEMKRVCKKGGIIFVHEPDLNSIESYPCSWAFPRLKEYVNILFADALIGRKLASYFNALQLENISHDTRAVLGGHPSPLKKFYAMTGPALGTALLQKKLTDQQGLNEWVQELERVEQDPETVVLMHPSIAIWGTKP